MKENTTGQTIYEQLQEFLNECIKLGWKLYGSDDIKEITIDSEGFIIYGEDGGCPLEMYYLDLFSVDTGIMEFVEWENHELPKRYYIAMCGMTAEEKVKRFVSNAKLPTKSE